MLDDSAAECEAFNKHIAYSERSLQILGTCKNRALLLEGFW